MRRLATVFVVLAAAILVMGAGCGKDAPEPSEAAAAAETAPTPPKKLPHPADEAALVERFTVAMESRDIEGMKGLVSAELGAELHRWHARDAESFWGRGQRWIDNVRSGVEISFKQDARDERWRALLSFENGQEETVIFTKVDGKLLLAEL